MTRRPARGECGLHRRRCRQRGCRKDIRLWDQAAAV